MKSVRQSSFLLFATTIVLTACGGGGGGGDAPPPPPPPPPPPVAPAAPTLALNIALKQLRFSWPSVSGATSYRLYVNPDGSSGFTQVGSDIASTATTHDIDVSVHLHDWANARYRLEACNAGGCTGSNEVTTTLTSALQAIGYFKNSNHEAGDNISAVAVSADGATLAVGAPSEDSAATGINGNQNDNNAASSGAVYVYRRTNGVWAQQAYIKASNTGTNDSFGGRIALSSNGSTLAVGAAGEDSSATGVNGNQADESTSGSGAVYVFTRDTSGEWSQQAYIKASNPDIGDFFGSRVALNGDGNRLAVAAQSEDSAATLVGGNQANNATSSAGAVYIFSRDGAGVWTQEAYIKASNTDVNDAFGTAIALSGRGDTLAVGSSTEDSASTGVGGNALDNSASSAGAVYVYVRSGGAWTYQAYIKAPNAEANDNFGWAVELSADGDVLAVSAPQEASAATGVNGNQANNATANAGATYVYARTGNDWAFQTYIKASNPEVGDLFGFAVAMSSDGNTIAVTAGGEDSGATGVNGNQADNSVDGSDAVYVFRRTGPAAPWAQRAYVKAPNTDDGDSFGARIALNADGTTLAVTSPTEESSATGIGGNQNDNTAPFAGATYVY